MDKVKFLERQYKRNLSRIVGLCYRYVNDFTVAEDLAQDVFLKAMENLTAPRAIFNFDHWLTRIAVNHCIDYLRQQPDFAPLPLESIAESASMEDCRDAINRVSTDRTHQSSRFRHPSRTALRHENHCHPRHGNRPRHHLKDAGL